MKVGLYYLRDKLGEKPRLPRQIRVFATKGQMDITTYHIRDADGREVAMHRDDAVVASLALAVTLKANK